MAHARPSNGCPSNKAEGEPLTALAHKNPPITGSMKFEGLHSDVFVGFSSPELLRISRCLGIREKRVQRGDVLSREGESLSHIGIVLEGTLFSKSKSIEGSTHLTEIINPGQVFGEDLLWDRKQRTHRTVPASTSATVLLLGMKRIYDPDGPLCDLRLRMVENLFKVVNEKNRRLELHLRMMLRKSLRERLTLFLKDQSAQQQSPMFTIPLRRNELAEHLNVDRTALSRELSKMKSDHLIDYHRNSFRLLEP
ncbi:helix-turn-helix domain-containing protein [Corynebacterium flavescens]|uniref:helix-turn-helix domain-containing protein n=1 Tax=Corynebacterium flavescens TaxID=28028 RepID=UPI000EE91F61|nr:hypothetical protein [Corynebacterium flavescens]